MGFSLTPRSMTTLDDLELL